MWIDIHLDLSLLMTSKCRHPINWHDSSSTMVSAIHPFIQCRAVQLYVQSNCKKKAINKPITIHPAQQQFPAHPFSQSFIHFSLDSIWLPWCSSIPFQLKSIPTIVLAKRYNISSCANQFKEWTIPAYNIFQLIVVSSVLIIILVIIIVIIIIVLQLLDFSNGTRNTKKKKENLHLCYFLHWWKLWTDLGSMLLEERSKLWKFTVLDQLHFINF